MEIQFKASRLFTFAVEPDLPLAPEYDGHPLADVVEVQDAQQLVHLLLRKRARKMFQGIQDEMREWSLIKVEGRNPIGKLRSTRSMEREFC